MLPEIEDWGQHFPNRGEKIFNDDLQASHFLFCFASKPNNSTSQEVNNYAKAVTTSMLPGQRCAGNSAYLLTSRDTISTNCVQVSCVEVLQ